MKMRASRPPIDREMRRTLAPTSALETLQNAPLGEPLAEARMADTGALWSVLDYSPEKRGRSFILGGCGGRLQSFWDDTHVLLVGGSRADKGAAMSNTLLHYLGSLFYFSSKLSDASRIAFRRGPGDEHCDGLGQKVGVFAPFGAAGLEQFLVQINPMSIVDPNSPDAVGNAKELSAAIKPKNDSRNSSDYFDDDAILCLVALILHVASSPLYEGRRNLKTVYELASNGDRGLWNQMKQDQQLPLDERGQPTVTPMDLLWRSMQQNSFFSGVVARRGGFYKTMLEKAAKQWVGVQASVVTALGFLDDEAVAEAMSGDTWDFADLKFLEGGASFLCVIDEARLESSPAIPRLMLAMQMRAAKRPGKPATGLATLVWLEEFYSLQRVTLLLYSMAQIAGYGCKIVIVVQSLAQIAADDRYGKMGLEIFYSGCTLRIFLDIRTNFDAEEIKKFGGEKEVIAVNRSVSIADTHSQSKAKGTSQQSTVQHSRAKGSTRGQHHSTATNQGASAGHTFNGGLIDYLLPHGWILKILKTQWSRTVGANWGQSRTRGGNQAISTTDTLGHSSSTGESHQTTQGHSQALTGSVSEIRAARPLLPIDQIINRYSKHHPGDVRLALVQICGLGFFEVERVRYWEHEAFYRCYSKDPDHEFVQAPTPYAVRERDRRAAERRPEAIAALQARLNQLASADQQVEPYALLAPGMKWVLAGAVPLFALSGAWALPIVPAAGSYACHRVCRHWDARRREIAELSSRITRLKS